MQLLVTLTFLVLATLTFTEALKERVSPIDVDTILNGYISSDPPNLDGPTEVRMGMYINSMRMDVQAGIASFNMYFRMSWRDPRLEAFFEDTEEKVKKTLLNDDQIKKLWIPDIFLRNALSSGRVDSVVNEQLCRVNRTGHVWHVIRLNVGVDASRFQRGFRTEVLPLIIESFKYTSDTVYFAWLDSPVDVDRDVWVPSYTLKDVILYDCSQNYTAGTFPCLEIRFVLKWDPEGSTFELGMYLVSSLLIFISWLGFWIPPSDKRIFLGLMVSLILAVFYTAVAEWREFSIEKHTHFAQVWLTFCLFLDLFMVFEYVLVYVICGNLGDKFKGICGKSSQEEIKAKRSKIGDILDSVCGLILFPLAFSLAVICFGLFNRGWMR